MREMKDSGIEWIGEIPKEWKVIKIKYLPTKKTIDSFVDGDWIESPFITDSGIRYLTTGNIGDGKYKRQGYGYISDETFRLLNCKYAYPEDLIISRLNEPFGRSCILPPDEEKYVVAVDNVILRTEENKKYICYVTQCAGYQHAVGDKASGTTMKRISRTNLGEIVIPLPPIKTQNDISTYLASKCSEIDALTADIQSQIDTLEQYKRSVITETVTKGLDRNVEMKESGIEWAEQIPAHWRTMHNKYLMHKEKEICPVYDGEDILSLTMQGVIVRDFDLGGKMPATFDGYQIIHPGNLLMCLFDYDVTPRCIGLIKNEGLTSPAYSQFVMDKDADAHYYYYYYLMLDFTKELLHLAKNLRHSFTEDQLGEINTVVPPIIEQRQIAEYLDKKVAEIDEAISLKNDQLTTLDAYKKSTIYEYVTGKKEVPA